MKYLDYIQRLEDKFERDMNEVPLKWTISEKLGGKITPGGEMKPFYGATTVIKLSDLDKNACIGIRERLFEKHGDLFVKLDTSTYHLTIHALSNVYNVADDNELIAQSIAETEPKVAAQFRAIAERYAESSIRMRALGVSTSGKDIVGIKFVPASEEDYDILIELFNRLEGVYPLGEFFVPHVSLGYFQLRPYGPEEVADLYDTLRQLNREMKLTLELDVAKLVYQHHYHMNDFRDVFGIKAIAADA